ncbi:putative mitochondrial protein [Tanacetum coccineum]
MVVLWWLWARGGGDGYDDGGKDAAVVVVSVVGMGSGAWRRVSVGIGEIGLRGSFLKLAGKVRRKTFPAAAVVAGGWPAVEMGERAQLFLDNIYKLHGLPSSIISDRDKIFMSLFWQSLFKLLQVQLKMSTAYHPQIDGQTEVVNKCLECYLRCMAG